MHDLASATEKLKDQTKGLAKDQALRKLEQAARSPTARSSSANADLQKQIDSMQKQLGNPNATPDALDKMQKELQKLQKAANFSLEFRDDPLLKPDEFKLVVKAQGRDVTQQYAIA